MSVVVLVEIEDDGTFGGEVEFEGMGGVEGVEGCGAFGGVVGAWNECVADVKWCFSWVAVGGEGRVECLLEFDGPDCFEDVSVSNERTIEPMCKIGACVLGRSSR